MLQKKKNILHKHLTKKEEFNIIRLLNSNKSVVNFIMPGSNKQNKTFILSNNNFINNIAINNSNNNSNIHSNLHLNNNENQILN